MGYDIEAIKKSLTDDNIISLLDSFDCPVVKVSNSELIFYSICHHRQDCMAHKPKLYWYASIRMFKCYSCNWTGDVFALVQKLLDCDFRHAVEYVCRVCGITASAIGNNATDDWRYLKKFLPNAVEEAEPLPSYDDAIFRGLSRFYSDDWLKEGIHKDILDKFGIMWYDRTASIVIPVHDADGKLCGIRARYTREYDIAKGKYRPLATLDTIYKFPTGSVCYGLWCAKDEIARTHEVILCEGEKSVLKAWSWSIKNTVAVFGHNVSNEQIRQLVDAGATDVVIAFDSDFRERGDDDYRLFVATINKTIKRLRPYFAKISVMWNNQGWDGYKFSPFDFSREQYDMLYAERTIV